MNKSLAQAIFSDSAGRKFIEGDWFPRSLPHNIELAEMSYPDTSYSFTTFFSEKKAGFKLGYASGNYGHGIFTTGLNGEINIGKFVVLQCTRIVSNLSVTIGDHCMFSWGSVITDSWPVRPVSIEERRFMLEETAHSRHRHSEFKDPLPVVVQENVWAGFESVIFPGVTVGRGAIIGSKSVVTEDIPPYAVVVGNPARVIKFLEPNDTPEYKEELLNELKAAGN